MDNGLKGLLDSKTYMVVAYHITDYYGEVHCNVIMTKMYFVAGRHGRIFLARFLTKVAFYGPKLVLGHKNPNFGLLEPRNNPVSSQMDTEGYLEVMSGYFHNETSLGQVHLIEK